MATNPPARFSAADRVVVVGYGVATVVWVGWRPEGTAQHPAPCYVCAVRLTGGRRLQVPESMLRAAHPGSCAHPRCQEPF